MADRIIDQTESETITGTESIPGTEQTSVEDTTPANVRWVWNTVKNWILSFFTNKTTVLDLLTTSDSELVFDSVEVTKGIRTRADENKTSEFTIDFEAGDLWESMLVTPDLGTSPVVKIGITTGGTEIADAEVCDPFYYFVINKYFNTSTTVYVNVSSGRVDCFSRYIKNRNT